MNAQNAQEERPTDSIPVPEEERGYYAPLLLAFGPADHQYEAEGSEDACAYVLGYN